MRPAKILISLRIRAVWSESSSDTVWIAKDTKYSCGQQRFCADAQAELGLRWEHILEGTCSRTDWSSSPQDTSTILHEQLCPGS